MSEPVDREAMLDLVAAYALGILPSGEQRAVAAFIASDAAARAEFEALRPAADLIGLAAEEPVDSLRSARMKQRLLAQIRGGARRPVGRGAAARPAGSFNVGWVAGTGLAAAAAVVFALVSTIQNFSLRSDLANDGARIRALQTQIAQNERVRARDREMIADLVAGDAHRFPVPQGEVVTRGTHAYLTLNALPALPRGKVYQAWTIAKGSKALAPSIVFTPGPAGGAVVALPENAENLAVIALSVEPEGGSKTPTSKPTFVRPLS